MATVYYRSRSGLNRFLEDHGPGGVAILADRPSRLIRATILVLFAAVLAVWPGLSSVTQTWLWKRPGSCNPSRTNTASSYRSRASWLTSTLPRVCQ